MQKTILVIAGPTASGKTLVAHHLAKTLRTEIISFDSRQIYKELKVGVARPPEEFLSELPYHFIASHSVLHPLSAGQYGLECRTVLKERFRHHSFMVMVGGTGFYLRAAIHPLPHYSLLSIQTREHYLLLQKQHGISYLRELLKKKSPVWYEAIDTNNPARVLRTLEIIHEYPDALPQHGNTYPLEENMHIINILLLPPREILYNNIHQRVDKMIQDGLKDEALSLRHLSGLPPLKTVGYREWFDHTEKSDSEIIMLIKQHTRHYAKRQITWFKNQMKNPFIIRETDKEIILKKINSLLQ